MAKIDPLVFFLVIMFGSSTWMTINAIWVELSLYTNQLPEAWSLPSYLATVIQVACLLTLAYSIAHRYTRFSAIKAPLILALLIFTSICMLLLAFFWQETMWIGNNKHSFALIMLTFLMASVCAASNVFFLPYMSTFHPTYMTAFFVGMSFSSLVPSLLKIIQGVGKYNCTETPTQNGTSIKPVQTEPMFSARIYNLLIFAWMCAATFSFALLHWKYGRLGANDDERGNGHSKRTRAGESSKSAKTKSERDNRQIQGNGEEDEQTPLKPNGESTGVQPSDSSTASSTATRYWTLIFVLALICAEMNTIVPSIQSYATLAYSMLTYHLALTLSNISHPLANFLPIFFKPYSLAIILALASISTVGTAFIFLLALQSPDPLLRDTLPTMGSALSIGASVVVGFITSYLRTHLTGLIRSEQKNSESALFWCGFFMQIGSFVGALAMFPLVNVAQIFRKRDPCIP